MLIKFGLIIWCILLEILSEFAFFSYLWMNLFAMVELQWSKKESMIPACWTFQDCSRGAHLPDGMLKHDWVFK